VKSSNIQVLPEDLINKIAAGEVVERPASVAKELIENAIDAGSTRIAVEVQSAGRKLIRVSDNGCGMSEQEIALALERHTTSKIAKLEDLFNIQTLGFRGEALPSIASVSRTKIDPNPSGAGVTVTVKDLFWNTPARKKFLKSPSTEMGHIGDIVSKYAMAKPEIAFELISDGKPLLSSPGTGKLKDAVLAVYGIDLIRELVEFSSDGAIQVSGLVSRPTLTRIDKSYENFYVNGRFVRNFLLNRALEEAYRTLIPNNRYPVGIVFIRIDPQQIDVNVHPTKREIKFVRTQEAMDAVRNAVRNALSAMAGVGSGEVGKDVGMGIGTGEWGLNDIDQLPIPHDQTHIPSPLPTPNIEELKLEVTAVQPLLPVYQLKQTYIVATDGEELALIDQHAAHERVLYDRLGKSPDVQGRQALLLPETIELNPKESAALQENLAYLAGLGFDLEEFGNDSFILRAVPAVATRAAAKQLLADILAELQSLGRSAQLEIKRENIRKLIACHSAIKAGDALTAQEMNQLIRDLYSTDNPLTCPHGRPTMVRIGQEELKKRFAR